MNILEFTALVFVGSLVAGLLGSLTGLGGGVVLVPLLTLFFKVDIRYAIGASLVSVIATSSGAAAAYVREGFSNIRIGIFLEIATTLGALSGAFLAVWVPTKAIAIIFGVVLLISAFLSRKPRSPAERNAPPDPLATRLRLNGSFPDLEGTRSYNVQRVPAGFGIMFGAGALSGLLGIGSGALKVLAMDQAMRIPFKVSTTTSNFMIGDRRGQRGRLSPSWIHRSRALDAGDAWSPWRLPGRRPHSGEGGNEMAAPGFQCGNRASGNRNALQRTFRGDLTWPASAPGLISGLKIF
jgi:uncharacterized membrane protein YfcA